jgi:hypothetical protein
MRMLIAVGCTLLFQLGMLAFALILAYDLHKESKQSDINVSASTEFGFMPLRRFLILNWVTVCVSTLLLLADIYLISYHAMLISKNTTTYRYIRAKQKISMKKSSIIRELDRKPDENGSVLDSEANANSVMDSVQSYDITDEKYKSRLTCKELFCCREKRNPIRQRIDKKCEIQWRSNQMVIHLNVDDPHHGGRSH